MMNNGHRLLLVSLLAVGVTGGCQTAPPVEETNVETALEPAPEPEPGPIGTKYVGLRDGEPVTIEKVSIEGSLHTYAQSTDECRWKDDAELGLVFSPSVSWENCNGSTGKRNITRSGDIWPLEVGSKVSYTGTGITERMWRADTTCKVVDEVRVTVEAGIYDTYKVNCSSAWRSVTRYYAPSIQQTVMTSQRRKGQSNSSNYDWELVRVESN